MTREHLDKKINKLKDDVVILESMVRRATLEAVKALIEKDIKASKRIYAGDKKINNKRFEIENECLITIATQQPMATDLRVLASVLEIITELERMGDYAKGIAKINLLVEGKEVLPIMHHLQEMAEIATEMLEEAIKAFVDNNAKKARKIPKKDDKVDVLFNQIYHGLVESMVDVHDYDKVSLANHLQWAAHNIERMADRVTNICERTIFMVTGEMHEIENSDDEFPIKNFQ